MFAKGEGWSMETDAALPIAILKVSGSPTQESAQAIGEAFVKFANQNGDMPWSMVSDLREMTPATTEGQDQWVANMVQLMGLGLSLWAVINRKSNVALQAVAVTKNSQIEKITFFTTDEAAAMKYARGIDSIVA